MPESPRSSEAMCHDIGYGFLIGSMVSWLSFFHLVKFGGWIGAWAFVPVCIAGSIAVLRASRGQWASQALSSVICLIVVAGVVGCVVFLYPRCNSQDPASGSDRDDALDTAVAAMVRAEWPYKYVTYQGSPISPMPGAVVLATPFALAGGSALQIPFWIAIFALTVRKVSHHWMPAAAALVLLMAWPSMLHEVLTGGDYIVNGVYVLSLSLLLLAQRRSSPWGFLLAVACGIAYSSRLSYVVTIPSLLAALGVEVGWRRSLVYGAIAGVSCVAITLPFYLYDPAGFTPLQMQDKLGALSPHLQGKAPLVAALAGACNLVGAALIARRRMSTHTGYLLAFAISVLIPPAVGAAAEALQGHPPLFLKWGAGALPSLILIAVYASRRSDLPTVCQELKP